MDQQVLFDELIKLLNEIPFVAEARKEVNTAPQVSKFLKFFS